MQVLIFRQIPTAIKYIRSPVPNGTNGVSRVGPSGDVVVSIINYSYGSPDMDWGGNAYCINPSGYVDFYNDGNIFNSYGK